MGNDSVIQRRGTWRNCLHEFSSSGVLLLDTVFEHEGVRKRSFHQDIIDHRLIISFVIMSSDLQSYVLVKRGAEL